MRVRTVSLVTLVSLALMVGVVMSASHPPLAQLSSAPAAAAGAGIYWGALVDGKAPSDDNLRAGGAFDRLETRARKKMAIIHWGAPWKLKGSYLRFQTSYFDNVRKRGSIPMLNWGSHHLGHGINQPDFELRDIYEGRHDAFIRQWAADAKRWGHPFFLRFNHEMNGWWYAWSEQANGNQPGDYVRAWRHVHDLFAQVGATNVTWVWCPIVDNGRTTPLPALYPGEGYVDWVAMDGYNWGTENNDSWKSFAQVFEATYHQLLALAPSKPIMIAEFASDEDGGPLGRPASKAAWIQDTFGTQLPLNYPRIKAVVWFNWNDSNSALDWPLESSQASLEAFAATIASTYYASNQFATLSAAPIQPLR